MTRVVTTPPEGGLTPEGFAAGGWWRDQENGRILCELCPRACSLKPGDRGFCFVRQNLDGEMVLTTYGRSTGFCIDPIEKKPLNHFYPGTSVLSFGTAGCNLGCKFCQNWDISKSREVERLSELAMPEAIAEAARTLGCRSVAFTYNDPVIWAEYAIDAAKACRECGVKTVAVTAGYITPEARGPFFEYMDAANVDLKAFTEEFYQQITYSHLQPVLDTLEWLKKESDVWFEITNLVIPQANDAMDEIRRMSDWILERCGDSVPLHFSAFHPDFRMRDRGATPHETLLEAYGVARAAGLKYVYVGNVNDGAHQSTYCPSCARRVIERDWYELGAYDLDRDRCRHCGGRIAGRFDDRPGSWGRKRVPVDIQRFGRRPEPVNVVTLGAPMAKSSTGRKKNKAAEPSAVPATAPQVQAPTQAQAEFAEAVAVEVPGGGADWPPAQELNDDQRRLVQRAVCGFVAGALGVQRGGLEDPTLAGAADLAVHGVYVTLKRRGRLRACCGFLGRSRRLIDALRDAAVRTALDDHRLAPISRTELPYLDVDVNLLTGFRRVEEAGEARAEQVEVGRHGLRIHRGEAAGLLLPAVAVENRWDREAFLRHVCRKAGLPSTAWRDDDATLLTFESLEFGGPFEADLAGDGTGSGAGLLSGAELRALAEFARQNVLAVARGMTPSYYAYGVADPNVAGVVLSVTLPGASAPRHYGQYSLRPGLALQATLYRLSEHAAGVLRGAIVRGGDCRADVTVLTDPAMHGSRAEPDPRGIEAGRAVLLLEGDKSVCVVEPSKSGSDLVDSACDGFPSLMPAATSVFSLAVQTTLETLRFEGFPRPVVDASPRRPAVAGTFYPGDAGELAAMVDGLLGDMARPKERWRAVMVPHAGLKYSGRLAAEVLSRVEIPDRVIVIGPKHTRHGVDWAVAPHAAWQIPGAIVAGDPELAQALAAAIPGLELDAMAHRDEHGTEVELPILNRLAPEAKVVGIALGGGSWERCQAFATALAELLRGMENPPLLVISSDMNHYATERETRELDTMALEAMEGRDPENLLRTTTEHQISMCGAVPATIVMETLRQLGGLETVERVGYATSADVTGDPSRVVGYAGVLLR